MPRIDKRRYTRLSEPEWNLILREYELGAVTLKEIAAKYAVSVGSILNQAKLRDVKRRGTFPALPTLAATVAASSKIVVRDEPAHRSRGVRSPALAEECIRATNDDAYHDALAIQHIIRMAVAALTPPTTPQEAAATVRAADMAVGALQKCNKIRRAVLRLDRENADADAILPELPITVMTSAEEAAMRGEQEREDREAGVEGYLSDSGRTVEEEEGEEMAVITLEG